MAVENQQLKKLASYFAPYAKLYAVGGYVRDGLLKIGSYDIDICSQLDVKTVKTILSNTEFAVLDRNLRMGTVIVVGDGFKAEYTTFRTDSYDKRSGAHSPESVCFTSDIALDARRRDFCCNAVYLDVSSGNYVDITDGIADIKNKIIRTADAPEIVFEADGLRILRMVRFAAELGFDIEKHTFKTAKKNAWRVKDIAAERIRDELDKIFCADKKHPELELHDAHLRGVRLLDELGLIDMLLPELAALKGLEQPKKYHLYDAYEHSLKAFEVSESEIRWEALLHDIGKAAAVKAKGNMHSHEIFGEELAADIARRFKFSGERKKRFTELVRLHMTDIDGKTSENKLRRFAVEHFAVMSELCKLKRADAIASCGRYDNTRLEDIYRKVACDGTPLCIKDLKVGGRDLVEIGADEKDRGRILHELWLDTVLEPSLNERERALEYIKRKCKNHR